ncbi:hypothetical protein V8G54_008941 [Vigna mungo]|uniref:Uncharacterized protein n=1 Tax=Vigna mungo TaxID=3915 RepID=A0AAQ3SAH9_VIGMU
MAASSSRPGKRPMSARRKADPCGWISDDDTRERFLIMCSLKVVGDCYNELVEVFYYNVKEVNGNIHSQVKGVDVVINDDINDGELSHKFDCPRYKKIRKTEMFKSFMTYQGRLSYGVFISKVLEHCGVNLTGENKRTCGKETMIGKATLTCIGMKKTPQGWLFSYEEDSLKGKESSVNHDSDQEFGSPKSEFETRVNDRFKRTTKRINN